MTRYQRIEEISGLPVVGKTYLVPTVFADWRGVQKYWPIIGPQHNDKHCLDFEHSHYHLDARFVYAGGAQNLEYTFWRKVVSVPISITERVNPRGFGVPVWRARTCRCLRNPMLDLVRDEALRVSKFQCLFSDFAGRRAKHDGKGWVCPHRNVPLSSQSIVDGVITCPLHLLRIDVATGRVLEEGAGA